MCTSYPIKGPLAEVACNIDSTIVVSPLVSLTSKLKTYSLSSCKESIKITSASQIDIDEQSTCFTDTYSLTSPVLPLPASKVEYIN